jgi:transcriptional regulator with XRE-family HTH domain
MLLIRLTATKLKTGRRLLGWSLQELATRSGVNWLTIKKYESAGDYLPPASVGALDRLVSALENAGVQFDVEGAHLDRAATMKAQVVKEIDRGAAAALHPPPLSGTACSISSSQPSSISRGGFR